MYYACDKIRIIKHDDNEKNIKYYHMHRRKPAEALI
jgi:hypothetical protein